MPEIRLDPDTIARLQDFPLLAGLEEEAFRALLPQFERELWAEGALVMSPAQTTERFFLVVDGRVRVEVEHPDTGRSLTLRILGRGEGHDLVSLLDGARHDVLADTLDPVEAVSAPLERWRRWLEIYPCMRQAAYRSAADLMYDLEHLAEDLALHQTSARLARVLLRHLDLQTGELHLIHDLVHDDIARLVGSVRVVVSRALNRFRQEGIIRTEAGRLHVADLARLLREVERRLDGRRNGTGR